MTAGVVDHSDACLQIGQVQDGALVLHCLGQVWMAIRSAGLINESLSPALLRLVGAVGTPADIKALLPDWASLKWKQIAPSDLSSGEWVIHGHGYRVNVYGDPGAPTFHHEVMKQVILFLRGGARADDRARCANQKQTRDPNGWRSTRPRETGRSIRTRFFGGSGSSSNKGNRCRAQQAYFTG